MPEVEDKNDWLFSSTKNSGLIDKTIANKMIIKSLQNISVTVQSETKILKEK